MKKRYEFTMDITFALVVAAESEEEARAEFDNFSADGWIGNADIIGCVDDPAELMDVSEFKGNDLDCLDDLVHFIATPAAPGRRDP